MRRMVKAVAAAVLALWVTPDAHAAGPLEGPVYAVAFDKAFTPDFTVEAHTEIKGETRIENVPFKVVAAGDVIVVSGRICAADPFTMLGDRPAFLQAVPNGSFPVRLAVADFPMGGLRNAFARVDFKTTPVVRWSMALVEGQDAATLTEGHIFGYPVDAGTGSFFDPVAGEAASALLKTNENAWEQWQQDGEANGPKVIGPYQYLLNLPLGRANAIMFGSGWGDGYYASYFGFDEQGEVAALLTDFGTLDWEKSKW